MLAERLAVVGRNHDQRALERGSCCAETVEKPAERLVGVRDFTRVRILAVTRRKRLRRRVGFVRIVEVDPDEPGSVSKG